MKKGILTAFAAVCMMAGTGASAQQTNTPTGNRQMSEPVMSMQVQNMCRDMGLTEQQADRVLRESRKIFHQRQKLADTYRQSSDVLREVLTPEQFSLWQNAMKPSRERMQLMRLEAQTPEGSAYRYNGRRGPKCAGSDNCNPQRRVRRHHRRTDHMVQPTAQGTEVIEESTLIY